jgi:hypothetical protein
MGGGGKGGGSSYTPPAVPALPEYKPPKPLPALPEDPAKEFNDKKYQEQLISLKANEDRYTKKAQDSAKATPLYTREERKSIGPLE